MSHKTIWVYRSPSEAAEIGDTAENLAVWAKEGYFPRSAPAADGKPESEGPSIVQNGGEPVDGVSQAPETTTENPAQQLPEGSQASDTGSSEPSTPPDAAGQDAGAPAVVAAKAEGKSKKG